jgi:hypothetical protein
VLIDGLAKLALAEARRMELLAAGNVAGEANTRDGVAHQLLAPEGDRGQRLGGGRQHTAAGIASAASLSAASLEGTSQGAASVREGDCGRLMSF